MQVVIIELNIINCLFLNFKSSSFELFKTSNYCLFFNRYIFTIYTKRYGNSIALKGKFFRKERDIQTFALYSKNETYYNKIVFDLKDPLKKEKKSKLFQIILLLLFNNIRLLFVHVFK